MVIKKSKTVTLERRGDLTSLYCIIGRYGPAVALAIIAMLVVWAAFIIYRTVKGQRKKDGDKLETEKDINPPGKTPNEEELDFCVESTEESDEDGVSVTQERSDEEPIGGIPGTNQSADPCAEVSDAEWEVIEEYHPGSPPEHPTEDLCENHDQADHILDQDEPPTNHCSLRDINNRTGHLTDIDVQNQYEQRLNEVELSDDCPCETSDEEPEINHEHTFGNELQGSPEPPNENLTEMTLSDTDLNKPLPEQGCDVESQEVGFPDVDMNSYVEIGYQKTREDDMDVLGENVCSHIPQVENNHSARLEYCNVSDAGLVEKEECLEAQRNSQNWTAAEIEPPEMISDPQQSLVDQQHLSKQQDSQDFLHDNVDPLCIEMEAQDGNVIDQWSELESRHTNVADQLSEWIEVIDQWSGSKEARDTSEISEMKAESVDKSMNMQVEETYKKTEINIMEATMDNNEWMTVGTMEGSNKDYPWMSVMLTNSSTGCLAEMKPQLSEDQPDSDTVMTDGSEKVKDTSDDRLDGNQGGKKVAAVQPIVPQIAQVSFRVHYLTSSPCQYLAVTGNQQELGNWKGFVPLERAKDGFWAKSVTLPTESQVEWKFVLVEEGEIQRWEECSNRHLETSHGEDVQLHKWWGSI